jgi:site-specific recombinase XerD
MSPLRARFIDLLRSQGFSERTVKNYVAIVARLATYQRCSPLDVTTDQVRAFVLHLLQDCKLAATTVNLHIDALRTFYTKMAPDCTVMEGIKHVKAPKHLPVVLSRQEVQRMLDVTSNLKHRAILTMLYSAGLRLMECTHLKPVHIESKRMKVRVESGKGKRDRYTVLSHTALTLLRSYYDKYRPGMWLFEGRNGQQVCPRNVGKLVQNAARKARIGKRVHPHTLRHCFATHLLEAGVSLPMIQLLLGHSNITTTMVYLHVSTISMDRVVSPLDLAAATEPARTIDLLSPEAAHA